MKGFPNTSKILGFDIQKQYINSLKNRFFKEEKVEISQADVFEINWIDVLRTNEQPVLIIGNPPWVTNTNQSKTNSENIPQKQNLSFDKGIDAITGKSNFDISEAIIRGLITAFKESESVIAMVCKYTVARKLIKYVANESLDPTLKFFKIDGKKYFRVSVSCGLVLIDFSQRSIGNKMYIYNSLDEDDYSYVVGVDQGRLISDFDIYTKYLYLLKPNSLQWRSGVKHNASQIFELMPLSKNEAKQKNGEVFLIENDIRYPYMKAADVFQGREPRKEIVVTQTHPGEDTLKLKSLYPLAWKYLQSHRDVLNSRKSKVYQNQIPFAIFGIGDYSFQPYKIAIASMYKEPRFQLIKPYNEKPVLFDDTVYFLSFEDLRTAESYLEALEDPRILDLIEALSFPDSQRIVTSKLLNQLNLEVILRK